MRRERELKDCGRCINCRDKPRWGGTGVRKQSCERKIQQETKRHRAAADALDSSLKELLADVAKATKSIKTAKKESDKEIDDCKRAGQRVLATHEANLQRIEKEATTKTAGFLKAPLKLGGIVQAISSLAKSIEEEEARERERLATIPNSRFRDSTQDSASSSSSSRLSFSPSQRRFGFDSQDPERSGPATTAFSWRIFCWTSARVPKRV